jgi:hypothetical protein
MYGDNLGEQAVTFRSGLVDVEAARVLLDVAGALP